MTVGEIMLSDGLGITYQQGNPIENILTPLTNKPTQHTKFIMKLKIDQRRFFKYAYYDTEEPQKPILNRGKHQKKLMNVKFSNFK